MHRPKHLNALKIKIRCAILKKSQQSNAPRTTVSGYSVQFEPCDLDNQGTYKDL